MAYSITNYQRIWVRGRFIDMVKAAREDATIGMSGPVQFIPQITQARNSGLKQILAMGPYSASPSPTDGYFAINLPATNDPDINPVDFSYTVITPTGETFPIKVPYDTPVLIAPGDPLNGERVLELANVQPDPANPSGTVQLLVGQTGRGISSAAITAGKLLITYDSTPPSTVDVGAVTGVLTINGGSPTSGNIVVDKSSVGLSNVNNTSDANKPVSTAQAAADTAVVAAHVAQTDPHPSKYLPFGTSVTVTGIGGLSNLRFVGLKTTTGAPTTGTWSTGDVVIASNKIVWLCTAGGTPGTWV